MTTDARARLLALDDAELGCVLEAAKTLPPESRDAFLRTLAAHLNKCTSLSAVIAQVFESIRTKQTASP